jgi:hypothetical protein
MKREVSGTLTQRLREAIAGALEAAAALEQDTAGDNPVRFAVREISFRFTDRLAVPATEAAFAEVTLELENVLADFYDGAQFEFERVGHERGPLTIHTVVVGDGPWNLEELAGGARSTAG